jgi:xanthine dehydrogenase accessory factor
MTRNVRRVAQTWLAQGRDALILTVIEAHGSRAYRPGARMLVSEGQRVGTLGGGHVELQSVCQAEEMLAARAFDARQIVVPIAPAKAAASVRIGYTRLDAQQLAAWPETEWLFHLQLFDVGPLGTALVRVLATLDCTVDWVEARPPRDAAAPWEADTAWPDRIRRLALDAPADHVAVAPAGSFYLVMTQDPQLDLAIADAILRRADFGYFGLLGSPTQRKHYTRRLQRNGIPSDGIARMTCPIGVEGISARRPEAMAIAVAAQLLQRSNR